jgi:hypothetical protein
VDDVGFRWDVVVCGYDSLELGSERRRLERQDWNVCLMSERVCGVGDVDGTHRPWGDGVISLSAIIVGDVNLLFAAVCVFHKEAVSSHTMPPFVSLRDSAAYVEGHSFV